MSVVVNSLALELVDLLSLCQDCLRLGRWHPENAGVCECGGDLCNADCCAECAFVMRELLSGRRGSVPGLNVAVWEWSPRLGQTR